MSRKRPSGSPTAWSERRKAYRKQSGPVSNPGHPSNVNRRARRKAKQPKTVGTIGLRPNTRTLLATLAMLAITEGADAERLAPLLEPTDES